MIRPFTLIAAPVLLALTLVGASDDTPKELGRVDFRRAHDAAFDEARAAEKPVLILFQEIPG